MSGLLQLFIVLLVFILHGNVLIKSSSSKCLEIGTACTNGEAIEYPFNNGNIGNYEYYQLGYPGLIVNCGEGGRPFITLSNHSYYYRYTNRDEIFYVWEIDTLNQACPQPRYNFSLEGVIASSLSIYEDSNNIAFFYNCTTLPKDLEPNLQCIDESNNFTGRSFAMLDSSIPVGFDWYGNCQQKVIVPLPNYSDGNFTLELRSGIWLRMHPNKYCGICEESGGRCWYDRDSNNSSCCCDQKLSDRRCLSKHSSKGMTIKLISGLFAGIGGSLLILLFIYKRRCSKSSPTNVEVFLQSYGSHVLQRYKYSDIKKMTNSFKNKLGQGGFGSVFKGKLPDGRMVAVKLLNESKGNGEEFINEVATIGKTNHVNVVTLFGFCTEKRKQALVYEFMVNGSLERFIYKKKSLTNAYAPALGWEQLYQVALGTARGLEYLHRGCNNRILHFDIKPHNILLDSEFVPKISDFGLAKLSQTRDSIVSMVGTRGTNGYIAPELYCRNFGVVSYKSDVYSYGMMLFEMIGGRKNIDVTVENISEIYFPHWIYNHLNKENIEWSKDMQIDVSKDILQDEIARKMIIVALWCIQAHPEDRPSMKKVAEMLEEDNNKLPMPPDPSLRPSSKLSPPSPKQIN